MREKSYRANATDINKSPTIVRYVFIVKLQGDRGSIGITTTYRTLGENLKANNIEYLKVVDLWYNTVTHMRLSLISDFLEVWRENYFDPSWTIPTQFVTW